MFKMIPSCISGHYKFSQWILMSHSLKIVLMFHFFSHIPSFFLLLINLCPSSFINVSSVSVLFVYMHVCSECHLYVLFTSKYCMYVFVCVSGCKKKSSASICMHLCAHVHFDKVSGSEIQRSVHKGLDLCDALSEVWSDQGREVSTVCQQWAISMMRCIQAHESTHNNQREDTVYTHTHIH